MNIIADGVQILKGTNAKTNKAYNFMYLYYRTKKKGVDGVACVKQFVDLGTYPQAEQIKVGSNVNIEYDEEKNINILEIIANKV